MYRILDEEIFLAPESIIWNALRTESECGFDEPIDEPGDEPGGEAAALDDERLVAK